MNDNLSRRNKNRNEDDIQLAENNEKNIDNPLLGNFLEKGKNMISQYMNAESQRAKEIMMKEEALKIKREREDSQRKIEESKRKIDREREESQRKIDRIREDGQRERERFEEDIQIKKDKEIMNFEGEIKHIYLKKKLRDEFDDFERLLKKETIPLNEEFEEQNQDQDPTDIKPKKKSKKTKGKKNNEN